jgi:hypothetical protein
MLEGIRHKWSSGRRPAKAAPAPSVRPTPRARPERDLRVPESGTEHWKRRVEAEARQRLTRHVQRGGARRN